MKIKELIKTLSGIDGDKEIFISVDEEGNDFKPICEVCDASEEEDWEGNKIDGYIIYPN